MVPKPSFPPTRAHPNLTRTLTPAEAQAQLADFLAQTESKPYLHPDAQLSASGIQFAAQSGPKGGLALHHLRRIEAGLRGENLVAETATELEAEFGALDGDEEGTELPAGDDGKLDAMITGRKRKRSQEDVAEWAEASSEAAFGAPMHAGETAHANGEADGEWQDKEEWEQEQQPLEGEVGEREGAPAVKQNGAPPSIPHVEDGSTKRAVTEAEKQAKREAKKAKRKAENKEKQARKAEG